MFSEIKGKEDICSLVVESSTVLAASLIAQFSNAEKKVGGDMVDIRDLICRQDSKEVENPFMSDYDLFYMKNIATMASEKRGIQTTNLDNRPKNPKPGIMY